MTDHATIVRRLLELARERFGERAATLSASDDLYEALGIDSMQAMDLLTSLEETFDVEIPDYELQGVRTFASIAEIVERRL
jgi:acyl carrier protein